MRNISEGGLQIVINQSVRVGSPLRLDVHDVTMYGQSQYCCPSAGGYMVGVVTDRLLIGGNELTCSIPDLLEYWASEITSPPGRKVRLIAESQVQGSPLVQDGLSTFVS